MSVTVGTVACDGFTVDYCRFGQGERPLVILPGLSVQSVLLSADAIEAEYAVMRDDFTVTVLERRRELPPVYGIADMARDTAAALDALGLRKIGLFGASQGGMIALELAASRPDLVSRAAVASTALNVTGARFAAVGRWIDAARRGDGEALCLDFGRTVYPPAVFVSCEETLRRIGRSVTRAELDRFVILAAGTEGYRFTHTEALQCPLWAAGSKDDAVFGEAALREIAAAFADRPGFSVREYEGFGHAVYDTAPDFRDQLHFFFTV